jgi:hypothetical protein
MDEQKEYWIRLFIKRCLSLDNYEKQRHLFIEWCGKTYNVSDGIFEDLKKKYTIKNYIDRLVPVIDKYFTLEDLKASIRFYSSDAGKKILDYQFSQDMGEVGKDIGEEIEKDFAKKK